MTLLDCHCIRREHTPVNSPKHDGVVESRIAVTLELGMASCLEARRLFGGVPLPPTGPLWAEACAYASDVLNMTARVRDRPDMLSPYQNFYGRAPFPRLLPFLKPGFHYVERTHKAEPKAQGTAAATTGLTAARSCFRPACGLSRCHLRAPKGGVRWAAACGVGRKDPRRRRRRGGCRNPLK